MKAFADICRHIRYDPYRLQQQYAHSCQYKHFTGTDRSTHSPAQNNGHTTLFRQQRRSLWKHNQTSRKNNLFSGIIGATG